MFIIFSFKGIEIKNVVCRIKFSLKKFYESLREHAVKIFKFNKRNMNILANKQQKPYENSKIC